MNKIKNISVFSFAMIVITVVVELVASLFLGSVSPVFWVAPLYFWVFYVVSLMLLNGTDKLANLFMLFKGVKMVVTLMLMFVLAFVFRSHTVELIIYFLVYYMLMLVVESSFLLYIKKEDRYIVGPCWLSIFRYNNVYLSTPSFLTIPSPQQP